METPLTASAQKIDKLHDRLMIAAQKSGIPDAVFQKALEYPGTELEDKIAAFMIEFSKKASGIVTPIAAKDTGLIPQGWKVKKGGDRLEGDVDLAKLDYSSCPVRDDEEYVSGETMMKRAKEVNAIGSVGLAADLLKAQDEGKKVFPVESRGVHYFIMPLTVLQDGGGDVSVAAFYWSGERWGLDFYWLGSDFRFRRSVRFLRRRE